MAPKPTPSPVPAAPGTVPQPPPEFGLDYDEIAKVSSTWSGAADTISELAFSAAAEVVGDGSDTLSAARTCGEPAAVAIRSITTRIETMASLVSAFASHTNTNDTNSAHHLYRSLSLPRTRTAILE